MIACYKCDERRVWYDSDGKAHSCHETCERHAKEKARVEEANQKRSEIAFGDDVARGSAKRLFGRYKWNRV